MDTTWAVALLAVIWPVRKATHKLDDLDEYWKDREADEEARRGVPYSKINQSEED